MPPQQPDRLPDLVDDVLYFRAHGGFRRAATIRPDLVLPLKGRNIIDRLAPIAAARSNV